MNTVQGAVEQLAEFLTMGSSFNSSVCQLNRKDEIYERALGITHSKARQEQHLTLNDFHEVL